jgi:hypothetical protein
MNKLITNIFNKSIKTTLFFVLALSSTSCFNQPSNANTIDEKFTLPYKTYALTGKLNSNYVFNSNSPEIVKTEGVLLSSFSSEGKKYPNAHLNKTFEGEFDLFTHHIAVEREKGDLTTLYQGILIKNPSDKTIRIKVISSASYLSQPDALFKKLDDFIENDDGSVYAGPGDRVSQEILRGKHTFPIEKEIKIAPNEYFVLMSKPIPILPLVPPINGITSLFKLKSSDPVYIADLALYEKGFMFFKSAPTKQDWINILENGNLSEKRDKVPSPIGKPLEKGQPFIYGRVAGFAQGSEWNSTITNDLDKFNIPESNQGVSYVLNTLAMNTLGTNQNQSAIMEKRYDDTAYQTHANYGVTYKIDIPLFNPNNEEKNVNISFDSPIRLPENKEQKELSFFVTPPEKINFRGEFKLNYNNDAGKFVSKYIHIVQRFGQKGNNLLSLKLKPNEKRNVSISYIYPADATPPHVLSISTK